MDDPSPIAAVLAVDDTPANLLAVRTLLKPLGHEIVTAASGFEALELAQLRDFAVILLDVMMPELDGLGTLERLRTIARAKDTPVIFLTAYHPDREVMERAYALGALDFVEKPIAAELLRGKVSAFVALYEQGQLLRRNAEALRAKDRHLGVLAHDLRTPLSVIVTGAQRLLKLDDPAVQSTAARIARSAARMERLIDDLLQFAKAAEERFVLKPEPMDLSALCRELIEDMQTIFPAIAISHIIDEGAIGHWDPPRLQQALANLLANAAKYGKGWVSVHLTLNDGWAEVTLKNGSDVIPPERLEQLFEPFVRGDERQPGVGLGLYIVREVARAHGGDAYARSDATSTRFTIRLPLSKAEP